VRKFVEGNKIVTVVATVVSVQVIVSGGCGGSCFADEEGGTFQTINTIPDLVPDPVPDDESGKPEFFSSAAGKAVIAVAAVIGVGIVIAVSIVIQGKECQSAIQAKALAEDIKHTYNSIKVKVGSREQGAGGGIH
jgi:hypothetical protein